MLRPCVGLSGKALNEQLRSKVRNLQGQLFGRKSEKRRGHGRSNRIDGESDGRTYPHHVGGANGQIGLVRHAGTYSHLPVVEDAPRELPHEQRVCPQCGAPLSPSGCEESEQIEIEVRPYRRRIPRRRYQRTCTCLDCPRTFTAPPAPKLIPKGLLAVSVWVEILVNKFFSHRPTERLLSQWRLLGLDLAAGTIAGGLERIEPLFEPLYRALLARNAQSVLAQADETRWMVFIEHDGKTGHRWWLWVFLGTDTVVFRLDPSRSHQVPEGHFPAEGREFA